MPVGNVAQTRRIDAQTCGCHDVDVTAKTELSENKFGRENWQIKVRNDERQPVYVTLAVSECVDGTKDYDTAARDQRIEPGCSHTFELPAHGNGYDNGAPYRLTVRNDCDKTLGVVEAKLHDC